MPTTKKAKTIKHLIDEMSQSQLTVLADYRGLSVAEMSRLRRQLRDVDTRFEVAKNTLIKRAADELGVDSQLDPLLAGPTAIALVRQTDIAQSAKALTDYARTSKVFTVKGAVLDKRVLDSEQVTRLAELPPRDILLARVVGGMQAPIAGLVTVLGGTIRSLMYVLQARGEQLSTQQEGG